MVERYLIIIIMPTLHVSSIITEGRNSFSTLHFCSIFPRNYICLRATSLGSVSPKKNAGCWSIVTPCPEKISARVIHDVSGLRFLHYSETSPDVLRDPESLDLMDERDVFRLRVLTCHYGDDLTPDP